jgi:hypothetical protein
MPLLTLLLAACSEQDTAEPEWLGEIDADRLEVTDRSVAPPTVAPVPLDMPRVNATGEDFDRIWREIEAFETWLLRNPNPELVAEIYVPGTEIEGQAASLLADLAASGTYVVVDDYAIDQVEEVSRPDRGSVVLRYVDERAAFRIVESATGELLQNDEFSAPIEWELTLELSDRGVWRIASIERLGEAA